MIYGNAVGSYSGETETYILTDESGNEAVAVAVSEETIFTATENDIRDGMVAATDSGVTTGKKVIPAFHTTETARYIPDGSDFTIPLPTLDLYDYTKLQVIICAYNTSMDASVMAEKVSILDKVYNVNSVEEIASVTKDPINKEINLGITNNSGYPCVIRCFTYKEIE